MLSARGIVTAFAMLLLSCAAAQSDGDGQWHVSVATSGGIAGRGVGSFSADSTGIVVITTMTGARCEFAASADEKRNLEQVVRDARPEGWRDSYVPPDPCCDRIEYRLVLHRGGATREVVWIDDPLPLPADLSALAAAVVTGPESLRAHYTERCQ